MTHSEIKKFAVWTVDSASIEITLSTIQDRIKNHEALGILAGAEYGSLVDVLNELSTYTSSESEVTWVAERITEMHKCILDDLLMLVDINTLKNSNSWELANRKIACERLLETYTKFDLRDENTTSLIKKCFTTLTSITDGVNMGKEA